MSCAGLYIADVLCLENKYNELKKSFVKSIGTVDPMGKEGR